MKEKTIQQLLVFLLSQDQFVTTGEIGQALNISKRTILNYMDAVRKACQENGLELTAKRGKGYFIEGDETYKRSLAQMNLQVNLSAAFKQERLMYVLYLLLYDQEECHISELESILHISRPSIYRLLDETEAWLEKYKIDLVRTRDKGIYTKSGEKRHRLAMAHWYFDCIKFLESQKNNPMYMDVLKLRKSTKTLDKTVDPMRIMQVINQMKRHLNSDIAKIEYQWLTKIIQIGVYRYLENHLVTMPTSRVNLCRTIDSKGSRNEIERLLKVHFQLEVPEVERIYLFSLIITSSSLVNTDLTIEDLDVKQELINNLSSYLHEQLNIESEDIKIFLENYKYLLINEIAYQIKEPNYVGSQYYKQLAESFEVVADIAKEVVERTYEVYPLVRSNKFLSNTIFLLMNRVDQNKRKLKTILVYDCNVIELIFIRKRLEIYFPFIEVFDYVTKGEIEQTSMDLSGYDLLISTFEADSSEIASIRITKIIKSKEINYINELTNRLYQEKNFRRIIKDQVHEFPEAK